MPKNDEATIENEKEYIDIDELITDMENNKDVPRDKIIKALKQLRN